MRLSMGADPEFMLCDGDGVLRSAISVIQGTKEKKVAIGDHRAFYDNVLAEVNILPANSAEGFADNVADCLNRLARLVHPFRLRLQASATYPESECQHEDAKVFGCEPEFDGYDMTIVKAPECTSTFRSAGGHIHIGSAEAGWPLMTPTKDMGDYQDRTDRDWGRVWVVRMMDLFLGVPSLWIDQDETSPARRALYGRAGTHRPKEEYGVEYRATSNFWLRSRRTVQLAYQITQFVVNYVEEGRHEKLWKVNREHPDQSTCVAYDPTALQDAINSSDKGKAKDFLNGLVKREMSSSLYASLLSFCEPCKNEFYREWGI